MQKRSRKQEVIETVFQRVLETCPSDSLVFDNDLVKQVSGTSFSNQFDATKFDVSDKLPLVLRGKDYFIVHLGGGRHQFVKGVSTGYHQLEPIPLGQALEWPYRKSVLNETDTSEASVLALVDNQRIVHDFLYSDIVASPKRYLPRRTKCSFSYRIGAQQIAVQNLQLEIDMVLELQGEVAICEGKNGQPADFAVYQLYHPFRYYCKLRDERRLGISGISGVFASRYVDGTRSVVEFRQYEFDQEDDPSSIRLTKVAKYVLVPR